jgi:ribosomal protein S18 acetylase RimI-like enzyme
MFRCSLFSVLTTDNRRLKMVRIRSMTAADLAFGLHLSEAAGWNQIAADWQRFLDLQPDGCFVAEYDGAAVGTTTTCIFGSVAWIAMVLVAEAVRGRGVGTALLEHALRFLDQRGIATVRLDARPMGQPIYERLGFVEQYRIAHYEGTLSVAPEVAGIEDAAADCWEVLMDLDERITRTDRRRLLRRLFSEHPVRWVAERDPPYGYWTARLGRKSIRLGPCIATASAGPLLLADAWHRHAGQLVSIDVPVVNEAAKQWVEAHGLTVQHTLTRMCRGMPVVEQVECLWASSGPEKG